MNKDTNKYLELVLLGTIDYTALSPLTNRNDIKQLCIETKQFGFRGVCVPPKYINLATELLKNTNYRISTVISFPFGYNRSTVKLCEMDQAIMEGANEFDIVWNLGAFLNKEYLKVVEELSSLIDCHKNIFVKVIVEECYLTKQQKLDALKIVCDSGASCIKTSTGYGTSGASLETVRLWKNENRDIKIKAAGGIHTLVQAKDFVLAGADIIGTSYLKELNNFKELNNDNIY